MSEQSGQGGKGKGSAASKSNNNNYSTVQAQAQMLSSQNRRNAQPLGGGGGVHESNQQQQPPSFYGSSGQGNPYRLQPIKMPPTGLSYYSPYPQMRMAVPVNMPYAAYGQKPDFNASAVRHQDQEQHARYARDVLAKHESMNVGQQSQPVYHPSQLLVPPSSEPLTHPEGVPSEHISSVALRTNPGQTTVNSKPDASLTTLTSSSKTALGARVATTTSKYRNPSPDIIDLSNDTAYAVRHNKNRNGIEAGHDNIEKTKIANSSKPSVDETPPNVTAIAHTNFDTATAASNTQDASTTAKCATDVRIDVAEAVRKSMGNEAANASLVSSSSSGGGSATASSEGESPPCETEHVHQGHGEFGERYSVRNRRKRQVFDPSDTSGIGNRSSLEDMQPNYNESTPPSTPTRYASGKKNHPLLTPGKTRILRCVGCDDYMRNKLKFRSCDACKAYYHVDCVKRLSPPQQDGRIRWQCVAGGDRPDCSKVNDDFDSFEELMQYRQMNEDKQNKLARMRSTSSGSRSRPRSSTGTKSRSRNATRRPKSKVVPALAPRRLPQRNREGKFKTKINISGGDDMDEDEEPVPRPLRRRESVSYAESTSEEDDEELPVQDTMHHNADANAENADDGGVNATDADDGDCGEAGLGAVEGVKENGPKEKADPDVDMNKGNAREEPEINFRGVEAAGVSGVAQGAVPASPTPTPPPPTVKVDVADWSREDVRDFFIANGMEREGYTFYKQEVDGLALLLMQKQDITNGMRFLMGPALKIHHLISELQRNGFSMPKGELPKYKLGGTGGAASAHGGSCNAGTRLSLAGTCVCECHH